MGAAASGSGDWGRLPGEVLVCDFHSVNVCRMNGVCWSQACRRAKVSAGAGEREVQCEERAQPWGGGREAATARQGRLSSASR